MGTYRQLVPFRLDDQRYALPLTCVERIVRSAALTPLPGSPEIILGLLNVRGEIIPAVKIRRRFRLPDRPLSPHDHFVIARTSRRAVIFPVDAALGVLDYPEDEILASAAVAPKLEYVSGIVRLKDGLILIHDPDTFFSLNEETTLARAIEAYRTKPTARGEEPGSSL
ncbi:MAG: chemotaxis protein CheW [Bacteroidia bacterium]|nr:MAG: chemotaxis protein CheW [Bacteroidia bacterium]